MLRFPINIKLGLGVPAGYPWEVRASKELRLILEMTGTPFAETT